MMPTANGGSMSRTSWNVNAAPFVPRSSAFTSPPDAQLSQNDGSRRTALQFKEKFNRLGVTVEVSELEPLADKGSAAATGYVYVLDGDWQLGDAFKRVLTSPQWLSEEQNALLRSRTKIVLISVSVPDDLYYAKIDPRRLFFRGYPCRDGMTYADAFQHLLTTEIIPAVEGTDFKKIGPANRAIVGHSLSGIGAFNAWLGDSFDHMLGVEIAFPAARKQRVEEEHGASEEKEFAAANWQALEKRVTNFLATLKTKKAALWTFGKADAETRAIPRATQGLMKPTGLFHLTQRGVVFREVGNT